MDYFMRHKSFNCESCPKYNIQEELIKMQAEIDLLKSQVTILNLTIKTTTNIPLLLQQIQLLNPQSFYNLGLVEKNNFGQSLSPVPLSEHIVQINSTDTEVILYSSVITKNSPLISDLSQLIIPTTSPGQYYQYISPNTQKCYIMDMMLTIPVFPTTGPDYLYFQMNNSNAVIAYKKAESLSISSSATNYVPHIINRSNIFVYYPYTTVYILIILNSGGNPNPVPSNSYGFTIWVMEGYSTATYPLVKSTLSYLSSYLQDTSIVGAGNTLPTYVTSAFVTLDTTTYLNVCAQNQGYIVNDALQNNYCYLDPFWCDWLYINIQNNNSQSTATTTPPLVSVVPSPVLTFTIPP
jgi:hypothetical protein